MPTTLTPVDFTSSTWFIQARTNSAGTAVDDAAGEDFRVWAGIFAAAGVYTPLGYRSTLTTGMSFTVGSGTAKKDCAIVMGTSAGAPQGYAVQLAPATVTVTLAASSASNVRRDQLYLVIPDPAYPTATVALPRLIVRQGDLGGALPGADAAWRNWLLLGTYFVAQNATVPVIEGQPADAKLQSQIMAAHAATHGIKGSDPTTTLSPRNDIVNVVVAQFVASATATQQQSSQVYTVTLPADVGTQSFIVSAQAFCTFNQQNGVGDARGQAVGLQVVLGGDTGAREQTASTSISGDTEVMLAAEHTKTFVNAGSFTVAVLGRAGISIGGDFTQIVVRCHITMPTPLTSNAFTYA